MNYFKLRPHMAGWATSSVMAIMPSEMLMPEDTSFLGYRSGRRIREIEGYVKAFEEKVAKKCRDLRAPIREDVKKYHAALNDLEKAEVVLLTTTDTVSSRPPYNLTRLAAEHPANLSTKIYSDLLFEFEQNTGKAAYLAVIDPPYLPAVVGANGEIAFGPDKFYIPHQFTKWHDLDGQKERLEYGQERAEVYEKEIRGLYPEFEPSFRARQWDKDMESNLLKALEAVAAEMISQFIVDKCEGNLYVLMPGSGAQKGIKEKVIASVLERKPRIMMKPHIADVFESLNRDAYEKDLTCSKSVYNRVAALLSNTYVYKHERYDFPYSKMDKVNINRNARPCPDGFIYSEWAPGPGECCMHKDRPKLCLQHQFRKILEGYENREMIKAYMTGNDVVVGGVTLRGRRIHVPSIHTVLKELNRDLREDLKPLRLPDMRVGREQADCSCSEIAGAMDAAEFHLKKMGALKTQPWLAFLADVGNVCHETMFASAPPAWRQAMEKPGIMEYQTEEGSMTIHFKPDLAAFYSEKDDVLVVIDAKSGVAPFTTWLPKKSHSTQLGGYTWYLHKVFEGERGFGDSYGVIQYLQDYQTEEPRAIRISTGRDSSAMKVFHHKTREFARLHRLWTDEPGQFLEDYYAKPYYYKKHLKSGPRGAACIEAVESMKKQPTLGSFS
ncbi:MAG: hypothetical protein QXU82_00935 [Candidatus Aenigmatarchaeota archaeon]